MNRSRWNGTCTWATAAASQIFRSVLKTNALLILPTQIAHYWIRRQPQQVEDFCYAEYHDKRQRNLKCTSPPSICARIGYSLSISFRIFSTELVLRMRLTVPEDMFISVMPCRVRVMTEVGDSRSTSCSNVGAFSCVLELCRHVFTGMAWLKLATNLGERSIQISLMFTSGEKLSEAGNDIKFSYFGIGEPKYGKHIHVLQFTGQETTVLRCWMLVNLVVFLNSNVYRNAECRRKDVEEMRKHGQIFLRWKTLAFGDVVRENVLENWPQLISANIFHLPLGSSHESITSDFYFKQNISTRKKVGCCFWCQELRPCSCHCGMHSRLHEILFSVAYGG